MLPHVRLSLHIQMRNPAVLTTLLGQGVRLTITTGRNLRQVLVDQIGFEPDYLQNRLQTIFVNARPIDDVEHVIIEPDAVIALSAAMPGLVGAVLRRGGYLSAMRRGISQDAQASNAPNEMQGFVTLKLFNTVAREKGAAVLQKGIWLTREEAGDLLSQLISGHGERITQIRLDDAPISADHLLSCSWPHGWVVLRCLLA
jgi:hypothetical protein